MDFPAARLDRWLLCFDDLAFLKAGKIFFCSCTHERFCSIDGDVHRLYQGNPLQPISELDTETGWQRFLDFALSCADGFSLSFRAASPVVASVEEFRASQWGFLYPSAHSQEVADRTALPLGNPVRLLYFQLTPTAIRFLRTLSHVYDLDETEEMPSGLYWALFLRLPDGCQGLRDRPRSPGPVSNLGGGCQISERLIPCCM